MALAISAYGTPVLRQVCTDITSEYEGLAQLIDNMWLTMEEASGVGLAAPQVNKPINLFIINTKIVYDGMDDEEREDLFEDSEGFKQVFINAKLISESEEVWDDVEGCLSLPDLNGEVERAWSIELQYVDEHFKPHTKTFTGYNARVIQHEYDHTQGILYVDHISGINKRLLKAKLNQIAEGKAYPKYRMRFAK